MLRSASPMRSRLSRRSSRLRSSSRRLRRSSSVITLKALPRRPASPSSLAAIDVSRSPLATRSAASVSSAKGWLRPAGDDADEQAGRQRTGQQDRPDQPRRRVAAGVLGRDDDRPRRAVDGRLHPQRPAVGVDRATSTRRGRRDLACGAAVERSSRRRSSRRAGRPRRRSRRAAAGPASLGGRGRWRRRPTRRPRRPTPTPGRRRPARRAGCSEQLGSRAGVSPSGSRPRCATIWSSGPSRAA